MPLARVLLIDSPHFTFKTTSPMRTVVLVFVSATTPTGEIKMMNLAWIFFDIAFIFVQVTKPCCRQKKGKERKKGKRTHIKRETDSFDQSQSVPNS